MKRGDIVTIALQGDFGKPRPALIIQSDNFNETHPSLTILPITSSIVSTPVCRITLEPSIGNGLETLSQVMVDKITTVSRDKVGSVFGCLDDSILLRINRALAVWLGIA